MVTKESLIFYTGQQPIQEMLSSVDPAALGLGQFALLDNFSISRNRVTARWGCDHQGSPPEEGASYRGSWSGYLNGYWTRLIAFRVEDETRIYHHLGGNSWHEATEAGNRFEGDGMLDFAPTTDVGLNIPYPFNLPRQDSVICGNGVDEPGVVYWDVFEYQFARVAKPEILNDNPVFVQEVYPASWFNICDGTSISFVNSPHLVGISSSAGSTTDNEISISFGTGANIGDSLTASVSGGLDLTQCKMFHILLEDTIDDPIFNYLNIDGYNNSTGLFHQIFNSVSISGSFSSLVRYTPSHSNIYLASFDLSTASTESLDSISKFRLNVRRKTTTHRSFRILAFMAGGNIDATSEIVCSFGLQATRVESPPFVAQTTRHPLLSNVGGTALRPINVIQPAGTYWMNWILMGTGIASSTCDLGIVYRKDPDIGDTDFFGSYAIPSEGSGWLSFNGRPNQKDYSRKAPSAFNVRPPKAAVFAAGANRLYAGGIEGDRSRVMVSDENFPMRFSSIPRDSDGDGFTDPDSGTAVTFPGEEVQRIVNLPGSMVGVSPVAVITNRNIWRLEGIDSLSLSRPTLLSPHGTLYPRSVAIHKGNLYFLDSERQPRVLTGGYDAQPLGIWKIEDQLQDGDPTNAVAVVFGETYKLAYRPPGGTLNQRVLNYEERLNGWHRHSYLDADWAGFLLDEVSPAEGVKLLGITEDGHVFEIERRNKLWDDRKAFGLSDEINIVLKTGELHGELWQSLLFGRVGLLCEKAPGRILTVTREDPAWTANDGIAVGYIDCETNVQDRAWRYDQSDIYPYGSCGIKAQSCQLVLSGLWTPGRTLKGLFIEVAPATRKPDVAA